MKFLRRLMAPEFQALAETLDSLDLSDVGDRSRWWELQKFVGEQVHGMRWHEKIILRHAFKKLLREQARADAMFLVMRVPKEQGVYTTGYASAQNNVSHAVLTTPLGQHLRDALNKAQDKQVIVKRKKEVV